MKIGFLISEYPGQTHSFFWREMSALKRLYNVDFQVIGTRPNAQPAKHSWLAQAPADYLYPIPPAQWPALLAALPGAVFKALRHRDCATQLKHPRGWAALLMAVRLKQRCQKHGIDHVHVHSLANSALIAALCKQVYGQPYSITLHGPLRYFGPDQPLKWEAAEFATVITETLRREVTKKLPQVADKISIAPMGVDTEYFAPTDPTPVRQDGAFQWFSCGRLVPGKGFDTIIRAARRLREDNPDRTFDIRIAGEDSKDGQGFRLELQSEIDAAGLSEVITLLGSLPQESIRTELEKAQGFVLISNEEALGVAYMEAMACGLPTIGARTGGVGELIADGQDGYLVPPRDDATLAWIMLRIMTDPDLCTALAQSAREKVLNHFSSDRSAQAIAKALNLTKNPH
ncbi:MAG: exopolysaccharide biosynthesis GT4 family glycosyltransferase EpsE [Tateyamaria sp.]|uniref:exopolysaccharide biosynthesis GT4 family glycosyltransferase EpsE n=1 Tax=Tateyamaria sp. TaxID=1929288 RepID=UPI00329EC7F9